MIAIVVLRTAMSALSILSAVIKGSIPGIIVYSILAALSTWFTATCLAIIGDAEGEKPLWRFRVVSTPVYNLLSTCGTGAYSQAEKVAFRRLLHILHHRSCCPDHPILLQPAWVGIGDYEYRNVAHDFMGRVDCWLAARASNESEDVGLVKVW
jgi:hypothetical protein